MGKEKWHPPHYHKFVTVHAQYFYSAHKSSLAIIDFVLNHLFDGIDL